MLEGTTRSTRLTALSEAKQAKGFQSSKFSGALRVKDFRLQIDMSS